MSLAGAPKPDVVMSAARIARHPTASMSRRQLLGSRVMPASPCAPNLLASQVFSAVFRIVRVREIGAADPFPTVAGHVEDPIRTGAVGITVHRPKIVPPGCEVRAGIVRR